MAAVLERERELASLATLIRSVGTGEGCTLVLEGLPGLGKSTLVTAARELAAGREDIDVLAFCCGELERQLPWAGAVGLLGPAFAELSGPARRRLLAGVPAPVAAVFDGAPGAEPGLDRDSMLSALARLATELCSRRPPLIVVDDAHWCDRPTLNLLVYLQRRLGALGAGLLLATRPPAMLQRAQRVAVERICAAPQTEVVTLRSLGVDSTTALLREHGFSDADPAFCATCHEVTAGNPFFVHELARELRNRGDDAITPADADELALLASPAVLRSVLLRLDRLPAAGATRLAAATAVLGDGATLAHAASLAELALDTAVDALDALAGAELLSAGEPLRFVHPLVRGAIYSEIPPARRAGMHGSAAEILAAEHAPAERVALHLLHAPALADPATVVRLRAGAARAQSQGAPRAAVRYLRRALAEPPPVAERVAVLRELAAAETAFGDSEAVTHLAQAVALADEPRLQARLLLDLGWAEHHAARFPDAASAFERGLALVRGTGTGDPDGDRDLADELESGYLVAATLDSERAADANARIAALESDPAEIRSSAHRSLLSQVLFMRSVSGAPRDDIVALAQRIWAGGALLREEGAGSHTVWHVIGALSWNEAYDAALTAIDQVLAAAQAAGGHAPARAQACYARAWPRLWMGELRGAQADGRAAIEIWDGGLETYLAGAVYYHGLASLELGEPEVAEAALATALPLQRWEGTGMAGFVHALQGALHLHHGRAQEAYDSQRACGAVMSALMVHSPAVMPWRSQAARALRLLGETAQAQALARQELALARVTGVRRAIGTARATLGLCTPGAAGARELSAAVGELRAGGAHLERMRALVDLGAAMRREGRLRDARVPLREAVELAQDAGAIVIARRAETELRAAGVRGRRTAHTGPESLTASERRVAELAAEGHSNRRIASDLQISVKAVEWHLHQSYRKLDIRGRTELAGALSVRDA